MTVPSPAGFYCVTNITLGLFSKAQRRVLWATRPPSKKCFCSRRDEKHRHRVQQPQARCNKSARCDNGNLEMPNRQENIQYSWWDAMWFLPQMQTAWFKPHSIADYVIQRHSRWIKSHFWFEITLFSLLLNFHWHRAMETVLVSCVEVSLNGGQVVILKAFENSIWKTSTNSILSSYRHNALVTLDNLNTCEQFF